jgi:hypothetical protein
VFIYQIVTEVVMAKDKPVWSGKRVMERWSSSSTELASFIYQGLPACRMENGKYVAVKPEEIEGYDEKHMTDLLFRPVDIEKFENEAGVMDLMMERGAAMSAEDARELGRLREEQKKWDSSVAAAVIAGVHFANLGHQIIRGDLQDFINKTDKTIPNTTIDKIWKALPEKYKKGAGRPRKK